MTCSSCDTFSIVSSSHQVRLRLPYYNSEDNKIIKDIKRLSFRSGNYNVEDEGIASQPLVLSGTESASCEEEYSGACFEGCGLQFPIYFNSIFTNKFRFIMEMSNNNENVTIHGLGDCMDGVYIIKHFNYVTDTPRSKSWTMTLEKAKPYPSEGGIVPIP